MFHASNMQRILIPVMHPKVHLLAVFINYRIHSHYVTIYLVCITWCH